MDKIILFRVLSKSLRERSLILPGEGVEDIREGDQNSAISKGGDEQ